jgi:hypothetical protein
VVEEIMRREPLITASKIDKVKELIESNICEDMIQWVFIFEFLRITRENCSSR